MQSPPASVRNSLLASLPADVLAALLPSLSPVPLVFRQGIYNPNLAIEAVYFPESGMFSLVTTFSDGMEAEVGIIGREGMLGVSLLAGTDKPFTESMVQMSGSALRMTKKAFQHEIGTNAIFRSLLLRYNEALQAQIMQTAACNGRHELEQRLARWLLMAHDRADGDELGLTQEFMSMMLGVHRPSVTVIARVFQRAGLIRYRSGKITVLDRSNLEAASCECYLAVKQRFSLLLG